MVEPWLTVALPVHNGEATLAATLDSAASERPDGVEFILLDSSAGYGCRRIAESFSSRMNIAYRYVPDILPWTAKTNEAMRIARGVYVAMLHQDDLWIKGHLRSVSSAIAAFPDAVMQVGSSRLIDFRGRTVGDWNCGLAEGAIEGTAAARHLIVQNGIAIPSSVIRREAWNRVGGLDPALWYTADWDLYLKLALLGNIAVRPETTTAFRIHGGSLTMTGRMEKGAFKEQMDVVLSRYSHAVGAGELARAKASIAVNVSLAEASTGKISALSGAITALARLGPVEAFRYAREARLVERIWPRLRLKLARGL
ncbi:glycosyltransferase [Sphingopyxis sp.]|jgi:glycosyltransferase involved in cell wall biosynthesis|uniref:glycosyltransferase n=1 Tax=Sphingopyxis sp. TaxID=1908224 RepID=UPI003F72AF91